MSKGPLEGIKVIELADFQSASSGSLMADMGANLIKIEDPVRGDSQRGLTKMQTEMSLPCGRNIAFETSSRSKRSITIDLTKEKGRDLLYQFIDKADIFYTNYRESVLKKLGADYESLSRRKPSLVYGWITMYGRKGPLGERRGYDFLGQARSGFMWAVGERDIKEPMFIYGAICDRTTGLMMALGVLSALATRNLTGVGQKVEVSMYGSMLYLLGAGINTASLRGKAWERHSRTRVKEPTTNYYKCADGKWIVLGEMRGDEYWARLVNALGRADLAADPRFCIVKNRRANNREAIKILDDAFATRPLQEWLDIFHEQGLDRDGFAYSPVYDYFDVLKDPQALENNYIVEYEHPVGRSKLIGYPMDFSATPESIKGPAPMHGQHTEEVLMEELGLDWDQIVKLKDEGVI